MGEWVYLEHIAFYSVRAYRHVFKSRRDACDHIRATLNVDLSKSVRDHLRGFLERDSNSIRFCDRDSNGRSHDFFLCLLTEPPHE